jgi:ABC-type proline/glycine betaine transport system permease subunit
VRRDCSFCCYWWNSWPSLFNIYFHNRHFNILYSKSTLQAKYYKLTTVVKSVLKYMINGTTSILKSYIFQICAAIYQLLLHMVFTSRNWFVMQGPVAIILISWNDIFIWETGYWTRAIKRFALFDLFKSSYSDTKILSKYIPSLQKRL